MTGKSLTLAVFGEMQKFTVKEVIKQQEESEVQAAATDDIEEDHTAET